MNPKFRPIYLIAGTIGLLALFYYTLNNLSDIDPVAVLAITLPDMLFFFLAYKTYPAEGNDKALESYQQRKSLNY